MPVAEFTRSRQTSMETDSMKELMQDILRKVEGMGSQVIGLSERLDEMERRGRGKQREVSVEGNSDARRSYYSPRHDDRTMRQGKIDFPSFDGHNVQEWIFKCERYFELDETPADMRVSVASIHLNGPAIEWHYAFIRNRELKGPISWAEYSGGMLLRFGSNELARPIVMLKELKEGRSYSDYVDEFVSLVTRVELSHEDQVAMFIAGLRRDNRKLMLAFNPRTLQHAIALGKTLSSEDEVRGREGFTRMNKGEQWSGVNRGFPAPPVNRNVGRWAAGGRPNEFMNRGSGTGGVSINVLTGSCTQSC
ncbi:hypothetical protein MLD38_023974 [Melastoma candidum]|uniref:Uncharacterized protein n=1 Tax=Melastoma candidum TaxID=119954 RepID=A0ACB9NR81_9MYRT|nr:hypothetical protein MLD38_023974 [Melastoma candidum]